MAGEFYLSGLGENTFDYRSYLESYRNLRSIPIRMMEVQLQQIQQKSAAISAIKEKVDALSSPAESLTLSSTYQNKTATLSDSDIASVSVTSDAVNGTYSLNVISTARANKFKVGTVNTITDINQDITKNGSLEINYLKDNSSHTLTINYHNKSLSEIVDEINQSDDIQASIINLGTSSSPDYQLVITSKNTGTQNRITGINDTLNPGNDSDGIFSEDANKTKETVSATDASIESDGIAFSSQTNTFRNIISGVSITVEKDGSTSITIQNDYSSIENYVKSILSGYNDLKNTISQATSRNQPLEGESSLNSIARGVFNIISTYLGRYGVVDTQGTVENSTGLLQLNETNFEEFLQRDDAQSILQSLGNAIENYVSTYSDSLNTTTQRYSQQITKTQERISLMTERLNQEIENLRLRFAKLNTYLSEMQSLQTRIQGFAQGLNSFNQD